MNVMTRWFAAFALAIASAGMPIASMAAYPDRTITIVVPYTTGGSTDLMARALAERLSDTWHQAVVIANQPGAGGSIGAGRVATSAPDGYTLLMSTNSPVTSNFALYESLGYETTDLQPVVMVANSPMLMVATPKLGVKSIKDLIAVAKPKPGQILAGISGNGSATHLAIAEFSRIADVKFTIVPYRGGLPMMTAMLTGDEVQVAFNDIVPTLPLVREGLLQVLATPQLQRSVVAPEVPTLDEQGMRDFNVTPWTGVFAPRGTPKEFVQKLNLEINRIFADPAFKQRLIAIGQDPVKTNSVTEFSDFVRNEVPRWQMLVRQSGAKI